MLLDIIKQLIEKPSITPNDCGCQAYITEFLATLGFDIMELPYGNVKNLWATYGIAKPLFVFAGHTDVVPPGPLDKWRSDPFKATVRGDYLFGRGAADMKGNIAAMLVACKDFLSRYPKINGQIGFLITGDEEGIAENGTKKVVEYLQQQNIFIDYCLIGEPSSENKLGDVIKIGRRGSISGKLTVHGKQGHIAYPHLADNPIHSSVSVLQELISYHWDEGNDFFQPTQFQISNIHAGTGAGNVTPADLSVDFNFRYSSEHSIKSLQTIVLQILERHKLKYTLEWQYSGKPFLSNPNKLSSSLQNIIYAVTEINPTFSTAGGTSDGRFLIDISKELLEFGLTNQTIHKIDECIKIADLQNLKSIYEKLLADLLMN